MRKRDVLTLTGVVVGAAGVITLGFLLKKFIANKKVEKFEEELVAAIVDKSPFHGVVPEKVKAKEKVKIVRKTTPTVKKTRKISSLAVAKLGNAKKLLDFMKKGSEYSQVSLEEISKIPYRSVRRYIDVLVKQGKIVSNGYGKGKKFMKS